MRATELNRRRKKTTVSALTATLPMSGGGEVPMDVEPPKRRTRKRKLEAADAPPKPRRKRKGVSDPLLTAIPPAVDTFTVETTLPGLELRELIAAAAKEEAANVGPPPSAVTPPGAAVLHEAVANESVEEPAPDYIPDQPVPAVFAGTKVNVVAIGATRITISHEQPVAAEGDLIIRVPGLFAELSRMGARALSSADDRTILELTRNAVFASFAVDALRNAGLRPAPVAIAAPAIEATEKAPTRVLAPTRALPATFGDARVALLEVNGRSLRVAHSKPLQLEGDHSFAIKTDVADFSGSYARVVSWERLQDGRDVYLSTLEVNVNAVSFTCGIGALMGAGLLQERSDPAAAERALAEVEHAPVLPHAQRDVRPLVPVVRLRKTPTPLPRRHPRPSRSMVAATILIMIVAVFAYIRRPDDHFRRAKKMIDAYEHGLMPAERDYSLPVYANTLRELSDVRAMSVSRVDAERLAERIRRALAQQRQRDAVKATMQQ